MLEIVGSVALELKHHYTRRSHSFTTDMHGSGLNMQE